MKNKITKNQIKMALADIFYPLIAFLIVIIVWIIVSKIKNNPLVLPMPGVVLNRFFTLGCEKNFWIDVFGTLLRTVLCFLLSFFIALFFAAISGQLKPVHKIISPIVSFLRAAPTVAVILILYAFTDNNALTIIVGFLIAFPVLYSSIHSSITNIDKDLIEMAKIYKISKLNRILGIYLSSITPSLFDVSRSTISLTLKVIVAAEILTFVPKSIGESIQTAYASFDISYLLAWTLIAIVFSFVLEITVSIFKKIWEITR